MALASQRDPAVSARAQAPAYSARASMLAFPSPQAIEGQGEPIPVPDRWRLVEALGVRENWLNPYEQNTLKGDRPIYGGRWFLNLGLESHSGYQVGRRIGRPSASGALDTRSDGYARQALVASVSLHRGSTVFEPPEWLVRASAALVYQGGVSPALRRLRGPRSDRRDSLRQLVLRELYVERHLRTRSDRYDFDSVRLGVQPFTSDFRGWLYHGSHPGVRLFGNAQGNRVQYSLAWFRPLRQDDVLQENELSWLRSDVFALTVYHHDTPAPGFSLGGSLFYERDRSSGRGVAPDAGLAGAAGRASPDRDGRGRDLLYGGIHGDGHLGRLNLSFSIYGVGGRDRSDPRRDSAQRVTAGFAALEASMDFDWYRVKLYGLWASGDGDPGDGRAQGYRAIREGGRLGGLSSGYLSREALPVGRGSRVLGGDGLLPTLRSRGESSAASFVQPGLRALGAGVDLDLLPELRVSLSTALLAFEETAALEALLPADHGEPPSVHTYLGQDFSATLRYRPFFTNNVVMRVALGVLRPGRGLQDISLGGARETLYSADVGLVLRY